MITRNEHAAITIVLFIAVVLLLLFNLGVIGPGKDPPVHDTTWVVNKDTSEGHVTINNWQPRIVIPAQDIPEYSGISADSVRVILRQVMSEYMATNKYDSSGGDSTFKWKMFAEVSRNKLQRFDLSWKTINTTTVGILKEPPKPHLWLGGFVGGDSLFNFGPSVIYSNKRNWAFTGSYGLRQKVAQVGVHAPLF